MNSRTDIPRCKPFRRTVALISLLGWIVFHNPSPVAASEFYLECPTTQVAEGDSFVVTLVYTSQVRGFVIGAAWHTDAGTADSTDYVAQDTEIIWGSLEDSRDSRVDRTFLTREDTLIEGNETFTVRFTPTDSVVDMNDPELDNMCGITIVDDDLKITDIEMASLPAIGDTYGVGETIHISATFSAAVEVDGNPGLGLWVGSSWKAARYLDGSGSKTLVFGYPVKSDDQDSDGIKMDGGYQDGNGRWHNFIEHTAITAVGTNTVVYRSYSGIGNQSGHKVDGSLSYPTGTGIEITSRPAEGRNYKYGETVEFDLVFSAPVDVDGSVLLKLRVGGGNNSSREATYTAGSGTDTLSFSYTVQSKDRDGNGVSVPGSYREDGGLGGTGTIKVKDTNTVVRASFSGLSDQSNHKLDGRPYVKRIRPTSRPETGDTYILGEIIQFTVTFDQEVEAEGDLNLGFIMSARGVQKYADYKSGSGTDALVFEYAVIAEDRDNRGIRIQDGLETTSLSYSPGTVKAKGTNVQFNPIFDGSSYLGGHKVNGALNRVAPTISSVDVTSDAGDDSTYAIGDSIRVRVSFSEDVIVTGSPQFELDFDGTNKTAAYYRTAGARAFFAYAVAEGDTDADGIVIGADKLTLNGGSIQDAMDSTAVLTHDAVAADAAHKVDGVRPAFSSAATSTDGTQVIVTFSEETTIPALLRSISTLVNVALDRFFIAVVGVTVEDEEVIPTAASLADTTLTMTLGAAVTQSQEVKVAYDNIFARDAAGLFIDAAGNALNTFSSQDVTNNSTVADAAVGDAPPDLTLSQAELEISEGGTGTYTVVLESQPSDSVAVAVTSSSTKLSVSPDSLAFSTDDWNTAQSVTLTANQDDDELNYWVSVAHTASGGGYDSSSANLYVVIDDDDDL